jgi:hypothetical protein
MAALDAMDRGDETGAMEHLEAALAWPESLGQGRPYQPEERLVRFLQARVLEEMGDEAGARAAFRQVVEGTERAHGGSALDALSGPLTPVDLLVLPALEALGRAEAAQTLERARVGEWETLRQGLSEGLEPRMILRALRRRSTFQGSNQP